MIKRFIILILAVIYFSVSAFALRTEVMDALGTSMGQFDDRLLNMYDMDWNNGGNSVRDYRWDRWIRDFRTDLLIRDSADGFVQEFKLGRIYTTFTPLTLKKTLFPQNYSEDHQFGFRWTLIPDSWINKITMLVNRVDLNDLSDVNDNKVDTYFVAARVGFVPVNGLKLGVSFVNQHDAFRGSTHSKSGFLSGSIREDDYPTELYVKFMDNTPDDKTGGAAVYEMKVYINGVYYSSLSIKGGSSAVIGSDISVINNNAEVFPDHREANGDNYFIYKIRLPDSGVNVKSVKFVFDIANDYIVQVSPTDSFDANKSPVILTSKKNVKDYSNRKTEIAYYSYLRGQSLYGIDAKFEIFGINIFTEYVLNYRYSQYPNTDGESYKITGNAFSLKWSKKLIRKLKLGGEFFYLDNNFDSSFSVEDDDDNDQRPDSADWDGVNFMAFDDKNNNSIKDYDEDFLLFDAEDKGFRDVPDNNNNGVEDDVENDNLSDTPYYFGEKGFNIYAEYPLFDAVNMEVGFRYNKRYNDLTAEKIYHKTEYIFYPVVWGKATLRNKLEYISDNIPNDLVEVKDNLMFQNNLVNKFIVFFDFFILDNIICNNKTLYKVNINDFFDKSISDKRKNIDYINIFRLGYNYVPLFAKRFLIRPLYKTVYDYSYYNTDETGSISTVNSIKDYLIFEIIYKFTKKTKIMSGYQKTYIKDYLFDYENSEIDSLIFEVAYKGKYWDRDLVLKFGVSFYKQNYIEDKLQDYNYRKIYLESYFNW